MPATLFVTPVVPPLHSHPGVGFAALLSLEVCLWRSRAKGWMAVHTNKKKKMV